MTLNLPETVEWLYSTNGAIHPLGRMDLSFRCQRSCPNAGRNGGCSNACCSRDPRVDRESARNGDGGASCSREASSSGEDGKVGVVSKEDIAECENGECAAVGDEGERLGWLEEKKRWISAAGVSTPFDLQRRIDDLRQAAGQNGPDLKKLVCDVVEVKTFLLRLRAMEECCARRKRPGERSSRKRKRSRRRSAPALECYSDALSDGNRRSYTERASEPGSGGWCLLDPAIMRSFATLAEPSAGCNVRCAPLQLPVAHTATNSRVMVPGP